MHDNTQYFSKKTIKMNRLLEQKYDIDLVSCFGNSDHLYEVGNYYAEKFYVFKKILGENALMFSEEATRAYLISEAAHMILREIAPKRTKRRKGIK